MRRSSRRFVRGKREMIWTALQFNDAAFALTVASGNIVDRTDWADEGGFVRGGVLERVRGSISIMSTQTGSTARGVGWLAISIQNDDEVAIDPSNPTDFVENDVIWQRVVGWGTAFQSATGEARYFSTDIDVDIKARRKLTTNSIVLFNFVASTAIAGGRISGMLRGLVSKP